MFQIHHDNPYNENTDPFNIPKQNMTHHKKKRKQALIELVKILTHTLKLSDCKYAYALIKSDSLIEHYKDNGYIEGDSYNKEMIKGL